MIRTLKGDFYIHPLVKQNLDAIKALLRKDYDYLDVGAGYEGSGKTTHYIQRCCYVDPGFNIDRVCLTAEEFIEQAKIAPKYSALLLDEGGTAMFSRDSVKTLNKTLAKLFMVIRHRNLYIALIVPNFHFIDYYIRGHRVGSLTHIYRRGRFRVYDKDKVRKLTILRGKYMDYKVIRPNFSGDFIKYHPLQQEYEAKVAAQGKMGFLEEGDNKKKVDVPRCSVCKGSSFRFVKKDNASYCRKCGKKMDFAKELRVLGHNRPPLTNKVGT